MLKKKIVNNKDKLIGILILYILGVCITIFYADYNHLIGDAVDYWNRGLSVWQGDSGGFSVLNIPDGFRGYVYPLYLGVCSILSCGNRGGFVLINNLIISIYFVIILPKFHETEVKNKRQLVKCVICFLLFEILFYGLCVYPLSDMLALIVCSICAILEMNIEKEENTKRVFVWALLFGIGIYCSYNIRTIYLFAGIFMCVKIIVFTIRNAGIKRNGIILTGSVLGLVVGALPQALMNYKNLGIFTSKVPSNGLMLQQVFWGLQYQRYDTYVGADLMHPMPQVYFLDPVGNAVLNAEGIIRFSSWGDFIKLFCEYPCEIIGIYIRHLINAMLPCFPNQYVMNLDNNKFGIGFLWFVCLWAFFVVLIYELVNKKVFVNWAAALVPAVLIIPGSIEVRFFVAVYLLIIGTLCYNVNWIEFKECILRNKVKMLVSFFALGGLLLSTWTNMLINEANIDIFFW